MHNTAAIVFRDGTTRFVKVDDNELLMDAAQRHGVNLPVDCREGVCGTCRCLREAGEVDVEYIDEEALTEEEIAEGHVLACQTRLLSNHGSFYFDVDSSVCSVATEVHDATVSDVMQVSDAAAILEITLDDPAQALQYLPGQYARLEVPGTDEWRAYSFATSAVKEGKLRFLIRLLPSGVMSDYLRERAVVGDAISLEAPLGAFYLREVHNPLLMVAGGTGLSAFLGMLEQLEEAGDCAQPIRLCYGVTQETDLSELDRLDRFTDTLPDFAYETVVMNPTEAWQGKKGVVCDLFDLDFLARPFDAYLCGPPPMIEASKHWLEAREVGEHRLFFEKFVSS
ncbi:anthranilate 1,2-dioxygenase electron transfer component AntC [Halomonas sp. EGI 63088]|uniref:Anthranilate 1,2-dioxygenase electron transfer component AntC n=1 Tax=Halomonas flagellata TaxID=2920385 RepID=A0ABS9RQU4_9GAMM|nr:anthranilate 1,2-dioxygenase electron transfer component AntC [Halomonas flagellata]MCH4562218.1 anthranilate 1,2-dioxygenase electron transfer component AntC [Halomonas flagellata]